MSLESVVSIDEHGRVLVGEKKLDNTSQLEIFFDHIKLNDSFTFESTFNGNKVSVEAFDAPWVIQDLKFQSNQITGINTYGFEIDLQLQTCYFDAFDRLNGELKSKVPWVLSRNAQEKFFNHLDEFDDDSFSWQGKTYSVHSQFEQVNDIENPNWWSDTYRKGQAGWDLKAPHPALQDMLPRLKLPRSRILILGCGEGHDAAYFAQEGHVVTAVDFSEEALSRARAQYGSFPIQFIHNDVFELSRSFDKSFDFVLEHTLYCAISPHKRSDLVRIWNRSLVQGGYFMGLFFTMEKRSGPPYGAREWEIRQHLLKDYHMLFWGRWKNSPGWRQGKELFVLGQKKS